MASAAVQSEWMSGPCPPMTTSCLPTALILHRGPLIWLLLILFLSFFPSFSSSLHLSLSLSLRSLCPGQKDQTGGDGRLPQQPTTWRAKRRKRRPQSRTGWVSSFFFGTCICECVSVMLITTRITLLNTSVMPSQYNLSSCVYEPGWLKPGCDITSAACMFPLRDS